MISLKILNKVFENKYFITNYKFHQRLKYLKNFGRKYLKKRMIIDKNKNILEISKHISNPKAKASIVFIYAQVKIVEKSIYLQLQQAHHHSLDISNNNNYHSINSNRFLCEQILERPILIV